MKKRIKKLLSLMFAVIMLLSIMACTKKEVRPNVSWTSLISKYREDDSVHYIIAVQYKQNYDANIVLLEKTDKNVWTEVLRCDGIIGKKGIDKLKEGDSKTPTGDFSIGKAFGIKENPGTKLEYIDINEDIYCCGDENYYNKLINIKEYPHECSNYEHMIEYTPQYNYGFEIGYNTECEFGKGSAIFFHCFGLQNYTGGCVAVSEKNMIDILKIIDDTTRVIINYQ